MIPTEIRAEIMQRLARSAQEHNVRILLAIESGSRAWGFASPNSDYDVRFIYAHEPDWYLAVDLEEKRDVIEYPIVDEIDLNGWDVRKALRLFWRSNPGFVEWIQSPIVYIEDGDFAAQARALLPEVYLNEHGIYHYRNMAQKNFARYLHADMVPLKKYFYVLRPILSVRWIERYGSAAPIEFGKLLHLLDDYPALLADIAELQRQKSLAPELGLAPPVASINAFIAEEFARFEQTPVTRHERATPLGKLNALLHHVVKYDGR